MSDITMKKYVIGEPFETDALVVHLPCEPLAPGNALAGTGMVLTAVPGGTALARPLSDTAEIYGAGEAMFGVNKRGGRYTAFPSDTPTCSEHAHNMYGSHNFFILRDGDECFGIFVDTPAQAVFDFGYSNETELRITVDSADFSVCTLLGGGLADTALAFRRAIGKAYIPPKWAFGYIQSRWGYKTTDDIRTVIRRHRELDCPLDGVCMDIDYLDNYKDFTVTPDFFPGRELTTQAQCLGALGEFSAECGKEGVHLVPIIDAAIKAEKGYDVYDEGVENGYFLTGKDGKPYSVVVWPGESVLPDFLNDGAARWFGDKYSRLLDAGIRGFWNDMNEPAIFYTRDSMRRVIDSMDAVRDDILNMNIKDFGILWEFTGMMEQRRSPDIYSYMYYNRRKKSGDKYTQLELHALYGWRMTRAAADGMARHTDERVLLFSRSSYIGLGRSAGIWTGDNASKWEHLLKAVQEMPGLNMCGFLYCGADTGGHLDPARQELLMRWLGFAVFSPLMRNHCSNSVRPQEIYNFAKSREMAALIRLRYRLIPYLYSEFLKCALEDKMLFRPLAFDYPDDKLAAETEDQLMWGENVMIAPVYANNQRGRSVYLPEDMLMVRFLGDEVKGTKKLSRGRYYIPCTPQEVVIFIRRGELLPLAGTGAKCVRELDGADITVLGWVDDEASYLLLDDGGIKRDDIATRRTLITAKTENGRMTVTKGE